MPGYQLFVSWYDAFVPMPRLIHATRTILEMNPILTPPQATTSTAVSSASKPSPSSYASNSAIRTACTSSAATMNPAA